MASVADNEMVESFDFQKLTCADEITSDFDGIIILQFTRTTISQPEELGPLFKPSVVLVPR